MSGKLKIVMRDVNEDVLEAETIAYNPPVLPSQFGSYAFYLLIFGFVFMSLFLVNIMNPNSKE